MSRAMKDSGIPWIGEIPEGWDTSRLKSIGYLYGGLSGKSGDDFKVNDGDKYAFFIPFTNIWNNLYVDKGNLNKVKIKPIEKQNEVHYGDVLFLMSSEDYDGIGKTALLNFHSQLLYLNSFCKGLRIINKNVCPQYLNYLLTSYPYRSIIMNLANGFIRINLRAEKLNACPVLMPSLNEQQKIADYLDRKCSEIDKMIALEEKVIEELKAYKQSVITEAVTKGLNPDVPMKDSGIEWIGKIPEHWNTSKLKKIANKRVEKSNEPNLNYIGLENLVSFSEEMVETENIYSTEGANVCCEGDVIFGKLRPYLGKVKVIKDRCYCSTEFLVLKNNDCPKYLRYLMLSEWFIEIVNASTYGTKMPRANTDFILNMSVPIPPLDDKKNIVSYLENKCSEIDSLVSIKNSKIKELKDYKKSIIYEYVTGKREVQ